METQRPRHTHTEKDQVTALFIPLCLQSPLRLIEKFSPFLTSNSVLCLTDRSLLFSLITLSFVFYFFPSIPTFYHLSTPALCFVLALLFCVWL